MKKTHYISSLLRLAAVVSLICPCCGVFHNATVLAQTLDDMPVRYSVGYYCDHAFLRSDSNFTVVDTQAEWPEAIDFADLKPLQAALDSILFDSSSADGQSAYAAFKQRLGQPVSGQLEFLPDDHRFCYVTTSVRVKAYVPRQWICMELRQVVEPQRLSPVARRDIYCILTFDLQTDKVLQTEDLLRVGRMAHLDEQSYADIFADLDDDRFYGLRKADVCGVWIDGKRQIVGLHIDCATSDEAFSYEPELPARTMASLLTRDAKRLLIRQENRRNPIFASMRTVWMGDTIYKKVDPMPAFTGGREALAHYLSSVSLYDRSADSTEKGEVIVAFVVDKEGNVCDAHVVSPVSPSADRHAVSIVMGMPRWQPGRLLGRSVPVRVYQKFKY